MIGRLAGVAAVVLASAPAAARSLAISDLLRLSAFDSATPSPDGRGFLVQTRAPVLQGAGFDDERLLDASRTRLAWVDAQAVHPRLRPLSPGGELALGWSPSGRRLAFGRIVDRRLQLGVFDTRSGLTQWRAASVLPPDAGPSLVWRSERDLIALAPATSDAPAFRDGLPGSERLESLRRRQALGGLGGPVRHASGALAPPPPRSTRVIAIDLRRPGVRTLARGDFDDLALSPSTRYLALSGPEGAPSLAALPSVSVSDPRPVHGLTLLDLVSGRTTRPAPRLDLIPTLLDWSPTGDRLLVFGRTRGRSRWEDGAYAVVEAATARAESVRLSAGVRPAVTFVSESAYPTARGGWLGPHPLIWARQGRDGPHWRRADGAEAGLSPSPDDGRRSSANGVGQGVRGLLAQSFDDGGVRRAGDPVASDVVAQLPGQALHATISPRGDTRVWLARGASQLPLITLNAPLRRFTPARLMQLTRRDRVGRKIADWLYLPVEGSQRPRALVVIPYPGVVHTTPPSSQAWGATPSGTSAQLLTAEGYAVLIPSLPRSGGAAPSAGVSEAVDAAVDGAVATGEVDPSRIAVWGHSFGGYAALVLATQAPRFRAVIAEAAPSDLISLHGVFPADVRAHPDEIWPREFGMGWSEGGQGGLGAPPDRALDLYLRESPVLHARDVTAPVLLIVGDHDPVDMSQSEEMFSALRRLDKDVELLVFPGETHTISSPRNYAAAHASALAFLRRAFSHAPYAAPAAATARTQVSTATSSRMSP